jgi:Tol biopolymer transport system component
MLLLGKHWEQTEGRTSLVIVGAAGRGEARRLGVPVALGLADSFAWTPDGRAVTFLKVTGGVPDLWRQPLDGGAPTRVTNFKGGDIIAIHAWSRDGKYLAMVRTATARDVVVIRDVRR